MDQPEHDVIDRVLMSWLKGYRLTEREYQVLEEAVKYEHALPVIAEKRKVQRTTVKKQVHTLIRKSGDASLAHAALRVLRQTVTISRAVPC